MKKIVTGVFSLALTAVVPAFAADVTLNSGGSIADAVAAASDGDVITLNAGTYAVHALTVDKGVGIVANAGDAVTVDLGSQANGVVLNHANAMLKGCAVVNCRSQAVTVKGGAQVIDCVFTGKNETAGTGKETFLLENGTIKGCTFRNFTGGYAFKNYVILQTGGTLADSVVEGAGSQFDWMVYVNGSTAVATNLVIRNCPGKGTAAGDNLQNSVLYIGAGLVTHSVITNSGSVGAAKDATVRIAGGTLRNSLVADCKGKIYPGVRLTSGRLESCTIAGNTSNEATINGYSLNMSGGIAVNNIFSDSFASASSVVVSGGTFVTNLVPVAVSSGTGNLVGVPYFVDPANGDYSPGLMSLATDAGDELGWISSDATDIRGEKRVKGAAVDLGAFEGPYGAEDELSCGFSVENCKFRSDAADRTVSFTARVAGRGSAGATCAWYLDEDTEPVGTGLAFSTDTLPTGAHTVTLVVTPEVGEPIAYTLENCVLIYPKKMFVNAGNATPEFPYDTAEKAATTIKAAVDFLETNKAGLPPFAAGGDAVVDIEVADGTYVLNNFICSAPVRIVAAAGATPVIDIANVTPGISFQDPRQVLDGFAIIRGRSAFLQVTGGACVRNCTVSNLYNAVGGTSTFFCLVSGGTVSNCVFNGSTSAYAYWDPVVQLQGSALVADCVFENMRNLDMIAYLNGADAVMTNCVFQNCPLTKVTGNNIRYQAINLAAGLVTHCVITNCGATDANGPGDKNVGGMVALTGANAVLRNCLLADNRSMANAGIDMNSGLVENCTVLGGVLKDGSSGTQRNLRQTGGRVVNSIFWNTSDVDGAAVSGGTFEYSSSVTAKTGTGNRHGDPLLDENYVPTGSSFARDNGLMLSWINEGSVDLRGSNRVVNAAVDMGAFEGDELAAELLLSLESEFVELDGDDIVYRVVPEARVGYDAVENPTFTWTVDGEPAGTSSGAKSFTLPPRGTAYRVGCSITDAGQTKDETIELLIHNGEFFVSPDGTEEAPYSTWQTAAKTLEMILEIPHPVADPRVYRVHFANGAYASCAANLALPMEFLGEEGARFTSGGVVTLNNSQCLVSNLVFSGVKVALNKGVLRDSVMRGVCISGGAALEQTGGLLENMVFTNNDSRVWAFQSLHKISGGTARNLFFERNNGFDKLIEMTGDSTVVSNVVFTGNHRLVYDHSQCNLQQYVLCQSAGLVANCVITNNGETTSVRDGIAKISGGTLRNALVAGNVSTDCAGVHLCGGTLENVTVVVNDGDCGHKIGKGTYGSTLTFSSGTARNCVFWSRETAEAGKYYVKKSGGTLVNCWGNPQGGDPAFTGAGVLTGTDPLFVGADDFHLTRTSPCVNAGVVQPWMTGATDLDGKARVYRPASFTKPHRSSVPDLGCYESPYGVPGTVIIIR